MSTEKTDAKEWIDSAKSFLSIVENSRRKKDVVKCQLCFLCHQATEQAIKSVLIHFDIEFPFSHQLRTLFVLLEEKGYKVSEKIKESIVLTNYTTARYPGEVDAVTKEELKEAINLTKKVIKWAEKIINDKNSLFK